MDNPRNQSALNGGEDETLAQVSSETIDDVDEEAVVSINVDRLFEEHLGAFGRYQAVWYVLLCLPCVFSAAFTLAPVFAAAVPNYRCKIDACDSTQDPLYQDAFTKGFSSFTLPNNGSESEGCFMFKQKSKEAICNATNFDEEITEKCAEWIYDQTVYESTIVTEFNLTCDKEWLVPLSESLLFCSVLVAAPTFGFLADAIGRKVTLMLAILVMACGGIALSAARTYVAYVLIQFLGAFGQLGVFQTAFILGVENAGKDYRVFCGIVIEIFFVIGEVLVAWVAYKVRVWKFLFLALMTPCLGFMLYWPFLPESLRWLNSVGGDLQQLTDKIAWFNGKEPRNVREFVDGHATLDSRSRQETLLSSWSISTRFLLRSLNICLCWTVVAMCYYGLSMNATSLAGSPYLNFVLVSLVEIPGYLLSYFTMQKIGRKWSVSVALIFAGISLVIAPFVHQKPYKTVLFLAGKIGVTCAFGTIYLYTTELYPTSVRTAGVGISSMCGRIGAIVSPYIALLATDAPWLPLVLFGIFALVSGALTVFLPETLGKDLPDSLAQALGLDQIVENVHVPLSDSEDTGGENEPLILSQN